MKPQTISEELMFSTTKLTASDGSSGTGFFFHFKYGEGEVPVLITNKHVVKNNQNENMLFKFHTVKDDVPQHESVTYSQSTNWIFHETQDLCFCFLGDKIQKVEHNNKVKVFYIPFTEEFIYDSEKLSELSAVEDVLMVGYPIGLYDEKNNFPLFRRGITSSHPFFDFNEVSIGTADIACFPGSSGSPLVILNESGYADKKGTVHFKGPRFIFLGIQFAGPYYNAEGELRIVNTPTSQNACIVTPTMTNIAYYIKAAEILKFREYIDKVIPK